MGFIKNEEAIAAAVEFVVAHPADLVFICVGSPQQELFANRLLSDGRAQGIGLCVGASLDFLAGTSTRAPRWMQYAHLEWLHRLIREPRRLWRRYILGFVPLVLTVWRAE
jgi:exopolysaccharide biosynthesis WecB/TagA/CpsF family protein